MSAITQGNLRCLAAVLAEVTVEPARDCLLDAEHAGDTIARMREKLNELDAVLVVVRERLPLPGR
jgi:hypothetical protein